MTDRRSLVEQNETPEDVATLYSWANLHGAKYRDFSASRAQTREKARLRVQETIESERRRALEEAERAALQPVQAVHEPAQSEEDAAEPVAVHAAPVAAPEPPAAPVFTQPAPTFSPAPANPNSMRMTPPAAAPVPSYAQPAPAAAYVAPSYPAQAASVAYAPPQPAPVQNAPMMPVRQPAYPGSEAPAWIQSEPVARPAWLAADAAPVPAPQPVHAPEDTLQGSRDRLASRWFALKGVMDNVAVPSEPTALQPSPARAPVLAVFSLAGGVGKTSLVATLGRALSAAGERVLLVDTAAYGLLPFYFGAQDQRPGVLRTFTPPGSSTDAPIQMVSLDPESLGDEAAREGLTQEIARHSRGCGRVLIDLATASGATTRRVLRMAPTVLVPVIPDMNSVVSVGAIDSFFQHNTGANGATIQPHYVLNQFDAALPLHLDVREVLRERVGDRLLPFVLGRTPAVSEALAEGMTVIDYVPGSTVVEDFGNLAGWVKSLAAPATTTYRGVRWSER